MKKLMLCLVLLSTQVFADTQIEAERLYKARGEKKENTLSAAKIYEDLANTTTDEREKGLLLIKQSQSLYYYGGLISSKNQKKSNYIKAYTAAKKAINLLSASKGVPKTNVSNSELALAHYFYAINLARWGQANGISSSIRKLPELMRNLNLVSKLDASVEDFGALRTTGRTKHKVPKTLARLMGLKKFGKDDAMDDLFRAYDETLVYVEELDVEISRNSTTVVYLLDVLADLEERGDFCEIYRAAKAVANASDEVLATINPSQVPEAKTNYRNLLACVADEDKCEAGDFQSGDDLTDLARSCR